MGYHRVVAIGLAIALATAACDDDEPGGGTTDAAADAGADTGADVDEPSTYQATIRRTAYGVPHILGATLGDVTFGQGYAFAQDYPCILAHNIVRVRSERARWFGPGQGDANINSDFAHLAMHVYAQAEAGWPLQDATSREAISGFVAGYNQWLEDTGVDEIPGDCVGAQWVYPISEVDALAYYIDLALFSSGRFLVDPIATAEPPSANKRANATAPPFPDFRFPEGGTNGWALGAERTESGRGMLLLNPHFEWGGEFHFSEVHLTIPGELNVYGQSATGSPGIIGGLTEHFAWVHTVSIANRFTLYTLNINPDNPLQYEYDDGMRDIEGNEYSIQVLQDDGSLSELSRVLYRSHYGPMINIAPLGWSDNLAMTYRDANDNHVSMAAQFIGMDLADDFEAFQAVHRDVQGLPWVNTLAVNPEGVAWYTDSASVPNLSDDAIAGWLVARESGIAALAWNLGAVLLDGSSSINEWVVDPEARAPGLVPFRDAPELTRNDYVANANGSHWLTNPAEPLEGFSPLYGSERTPRAPRTRLNLVMLSESDPGRASGEDGLFNLGELQEALYGNRAMLAELLQDQVSERCAGVGTVPLGEESVDISEACDILAAWDGRLDLGSVGAVVWREFLGSLPPEALLDAGDLFAVPFDPEDPVATPHTLAAAPAEGDDPVLEALARAVQRLQGAGIALDTPLGDVQLTRRGDREIPMHGGIDSVEGAFNVVEYRTSANSTIADIPRGAVINANTGLSDDGYVINAGTNLAMVIEFTDGGPRARAIFTRSQSDDPASPHFADQTELYSQEGWRDVLFTEEAIAADPELTILEVSGPR